MTQWLLSRRRLMGGILGFVTPSAGLMSAKADGISTLDYCYWRNEQITQCSGGTRYEQWCYYCNDPGTGWTIYKCDWRPDGSC